MALLSVFIEGLFHAPGRVARRRGSKAGGVVKRRHRAALIHRAPEAARAAPRALQRARRLPTARECRDEPHQRRKRLPPPCRRERPRRARHHRPIARAREDSRRFLQIATKTSSAEPLHFLTHGEPRIRVVRGDVRSKGRRLALRTDAMRRGVKSDPPPTLSASRDRSAAPARAGRR